MLCRWLRQGSNTMLDWSNAGHVFDTMTAVQLPLPQGKENAHARPLLVCPLRRKTLCTQAFCSKSFEWIGRLAPKGRKAAIAIDFSALSDILSPKGRKCPSVFGTRLRGANGMDGHCSI
ncbi:hypothetical protein NPIL_316311 [Nephila pilipes]|uniref:Uncharacterized protein n=1 Tax=Nephila pilipes TaxID=299642 RepID=A0A8X6NG48_NEPPI|nr:hypothetical protein NPIL_316311 [Nephila pilipes]